MNRPTPSLDAVLSAMLLCMVCGFCLLAVATAFVTGLAIGKFIVLPLAEMLTGFGA